MRAFVFTDKALGRHAGQFVWLSIDTEKPANAAFLQKFPVQVWPSFFVVDPASEKIALRWVGGATVPQLEKILADGRAAVSGKGRGVEQLLAGADRLYGEGKNAEAAAAYREALSRAPRDWPRYGRATESLLFALQSAKAKEDCARAARDALAKLARTSSAANVASIGLDCAVDMAKENPARAELVAALAAASREILAAPRPDIAADDVSSLYESLAVGREDATDEPGRRRALSPRA